MKRRGFLALIASATLLLSACSGGTESGSGSGTSGDADYSIAITQIVSHPALDASVEGFKEAIADAGLNVAYTESNANNDQTIVASIAGTLAKDDYDLILAVATPMAQGVAQAVATAPVLFTAVTDPVSAGLVDSVEAPGANVTGTTDANPVRQQLKLIKEIQPDAASIGVVYHSGEANSIVQVGWVKEAAADLGLEVKEATVTNTSEVQQAADSLDVDAIYVPTDNTVVSAIDSVLAIGESKKIPVYSAEGDTVKNGAIATYGLSYHALGYQTGEMAVRILQGADPASMPVESQKDLLLYLNLAAAERMGVTIPDDVVGRAETENIYK